MATSGTFTGARGGSSTGPYLKLTWSLLTQDIANNKSQVRLTLSLVSDYDIGFSASKSGHLEGTSFTYTGGMSSAGTKTLKTSDLWYTHGSDGKLSTTIDGDLALNISWGGSSTGTLTVSGTMNPTDIPRASDFTAFSLSNSVLNTSTAVTVNYTLNRKASGFSQDMTLKYGSTVIKSWNTASTGALTQALSTTEVNNIIKAMSTVTSGTLTLTMQTKSGTTNIGSLVSRTASVSLNSAIAPTASGLAVSIYGTGRDKTLNKYVQTISKVTASFTDGAGYGATIKSSTIIVKRSSDSGDSQTIASDSGTTANAVKLSGTYSVTATVTDSRGRTASVSTTITVVAYAPPTISTFSTNRDAANTTNVIGTISSSFSMGTDNPTDVSVVGKDKAGVSTTLYTLNDTTTSPINLTQTYASQSDASSYTYTLTITDSFGNKGTATSKVSTTFVEFTIAKGYGIGVGKVWEDGALDVGGKGTFSLPSGGQVLKLNDKSYVAGTNGLYSYMAFSDGVASYLAYIGFSSARDNTLNINNSTIGDIKLTPKSGGTVWVMGTLNVNNANIENVNHIQIADTGGGEGLEWVDATNNWKIVVSPDDGSNATGPLQFFRNGVRMMTIGTTGALYFTGATATNGGRIETDGVNGNSSFIAYGYAKVQSAGAGEDLYLQANSEIRCVAPNTTTTYKPILASAFTVNSDRKVKRNIKATERGALDKVRSTTVYDYHLDNELGWYELVDEKYTKLYDHVPEKVKKRKGLIMDEAPEEIVFSDGIDLYAMTSMLWKAVQELTDEVEDLRKRLKNK